MRWFLKAAISQTALAIAVPMVAATMLVLVDAARSAEQPTGHISIKTPGELTSAEAQRAYDAVAREMATGYAHADYSKAREYRQWRRHNTAPYLSATHGNRYVNNYANDLATGYENVGNGHVLAEGAILAKDSFTVTESGKVLPAPLFVMEKLAVGTSPETGDWRYAMILPDGSVFGDSRGAGSERTAFCHECHTAVADADYLYFVPEAYQVRE